LLFLFAVSRLPVIEEVPEPIDPHVVIIDPATLSQLVKTKPVSNVKDRVSEPEFPKKAVSASVDFTKPKEKEADRAKVKSSEPGKKIEERRNALSGEGTRTKGLEGARGSKLPSRESGSAAHRLSPSPGSGRGGTQTASDDQGPLQAIQGATSKFLDLLGGSPKLGKSGSRLEGFGDREGRGDSGVALEGSGRGGGGVADPLIGGAGARNRGGSKVGVGPGAEGTGRGMVGGRVRIELNSGGSNESVVIGSIDRDAIEAAFRAHANEFRYCYEREINSGHPGLKGKVVAAFVIEASGRADSVSVASSSIASVNVENCVLGVISRIQFPKPGGGVPVTIKYPISFMNSSK
jgi:outer membrane biosynthesis protein TonB